MSRLEIGGLIGGFLLGLFGWLVLFARWARSI